MDGILYVVCEAQSQVICTFTCDFFTFLTIIEDTSLLAPRVYGLNAPGLISPSQHPVEIDDDKEEEI